ncbi:hypothetical protein BOTBODRAFT_209782 [Botryobasidium botryosum FD-172 SS1]|uniref:Uncharacterized protein n=1 Tax=Botryobasidium botryosum (strain FD-172 SS1) TaxID=930990 RepID=A0A067N0X6_BOTB1|nr:hypothetical protein BOTBODRAFT_209782 [Botryobasidium botryosum FD-172 SS1]
MRTESFLMSFVMILTSLTLTIFSVTLPDWIESASLPNHPHQHHIRYGLFQRCVYASIDFPDTPPPFAPVTSTTLITPDSKAYHKPSKHKVYKCEHFPSKEQCASDEEAQGFCTWWALAGNMSLVGVMLAVGALPPLLLGGFEGETGYSWRSMWKVVLLVVGMHAVLQIATMGIALHLHGTSHLIFMKGSTLSTSFRLNVVSWILDIFVIGTGVASLVGRQWDSDENGYYPIPG